MSRPARGLALLLATVLLLAPVVPFAAVGGAAAAPAGMSTIPDANVAQDVPSGESLALSASELEGGVMASEHADSLEVVLTTADNAPSVMDSDAAAVSGDGMALVLRDDQQSAGREVALDAGQLQDALGYRPEAIRGTHEDGSTWTASAEYVDGYLVFDVPHFSSNTVTFSGAVEIDATGATNGTQFTYTVADGANISDASLHFTGQPNTQWDNVSATGVGDGGTVNTDIGGDLDPTGPSTNDEPTITLTGVKDTEIAAIGQYADLGYYDSGSLKTGGFAGSTGDVGGMADINGDGDTEMIYTKGSTLHFVDESGNVQDTGIQAIKVGGVGDIDGTGDLEVAIRSSSDDTLRYVDGIENVVNTNIGMNGGGPGGVGDIDDDGNEEIAYVDDSSNLKYVDIASGESPVDTGLEAAAVGGMGDIDGDGDLDIAYTDTSDNLKYVDESGNTADTGVDAFDIGGVGDADGDGEVEIVYGGLPGERLEYVDANGNNVDTGVKTDDVGGVADINSDSTTDPAADIDGDGTDEVSVSGGLSGSITKPIPSLSTDDDTTTISTSKGKVDITIELRERTQTTDPSVKLNSGSGSQTIDYTGTLDDDESVNLSDEIDESLIGGSTTVTVTVDDPTSGPAGQVDLNYSHSAQDQVSTTYQSSTFEESYNVSHTYSDATDNAQVTIPFASSRVVGVSNVEYRVDGGSWSRVASANYRLDGTTLDVYLDDATGGVEAGQTVDVRATGRKISVANGAVTVTDPTAPGEELDTQLRIDSRSEDFHVNVGPTDDGDRVHYAYADGFPTEDYVVIDSAGNQQLYLPNAVTGDQFRVRHLDTRVVAEQGDVRIDVIEAGQDPELDVSPGPGGSGDPVTVEYYNTESGVTYLLNSLTRSIVVDSDTAESPAIFEDDDSEDTWAILRDSGPTGSSGGGGAVGQFREAASGAVGSVSLPVDGSGLGQLALVGVLGLGGLLVLRRFNPFGGSSDSDSAAVTSSTSTGSASGSAVSRLTGLASTAGAVGSRAAQTTGSGVLAALRRLLAYFGQVATLILGNRRASITAGVVAAIVAARVGLVSLPEGTGILIVVAGVPVATWLILRQNNAASTRVWLGSTIAAVILGLEFVAPGTVQTAIEQLTSETVAPLLILVAAGGLYLWYRARQSDRPQIIIGGDSE